MTDMTQEETMSAATQFADVYIENDHIAELCSTADRLRRAARAVDYALYRANLTAADFPGELASPGIGPDFVRFYNVTARLEELGDLVAKLVQDYGGVQFAVSRSLQQSSALHTVGKEFGFELGSGFCMNDVLVAIRNLKQDS